MPELTDCPKCGRSLQDDAPKGLCPACLLAAVVSEPEPSRVEDRFHSPTTPGPARFVPPSVASLQPLFPQLEILGLLGHGGMGAVYKARQKKLDRLVALKIIRPEAAADPAFAERFNREARTLARLSHPHIVAVHDFGEAGPSTLGAAVQSGPVFYFLMEYVDGANLRQLMEGARLEPSQALAIVPQVCEALQFAHDEGVVHRDIKPENILIDSKGRVKIADFGLAKLVTGSAHDFTLTATHQVMGTPRYMAPEQMEGSHSVDHRADIYSLGVVFYEMLTGEVPAGHFEPPSKKAETDPRLDEIVLRAMAREPERRFQQASHFASEVELAKAADGNAAPARSSGSSTTRAAGDVIPAMSSFLSQEARAIYRWAVGGSVQSADRNASPQWLMLLLCLVPCAMLFFPWFDVYVTDPAATRGLDRRFLTVYQNLPAWQRDVSPLELPSQIASGLAVCGLLMVQVCSLGPGRASSLSLLPRLILCALALLLVMAHHTDLSQWSVTVFADPETDTFPIGTGGNFDSSGSGTSRLASLHHVILYRPAFFAFVVSLFLLVVLLGIDFKHAMLHRKLCPQAAESAQFCDLMAGMRRVRSGLAQILGLGATSSPLDLPAQLLLWNAMFLIGSVFLLFAIMVVIVEERVGHATGPPAVAVIMLLFPIAAAILQAALAIVASSGVRHGRLRGLAVAVCVMLLFPLTITWPVTMPLAAWCLAVLYRPDVRRLFDVTENTASMNPNALTFAAAESADIPRQAGRSSLRNPVVPEISPLRTAWNEWWGRRHLWLTRIVQTVLSLAFVVSFILFISFGTTSTVVYPTPGGQGMRQTHVQFGTPSPWFELNQNVGGTPGFEWKILWYSSSVGIMLLGLLAYWIYWQIESAKPGFKPSSWSSPGFVYSGVGAVAFFSILLGQSPLLLPDWKQSPTSSSPTIAQNIEESPASPEELRRMAAQAQGNFVNAIRADSISQVKEWLRMGMSVDQVDSMGLTPLGHAVIVGKDRIVMYLILNGADEQQMTFGRTPLMLAVEMGHQSVVRALQDLEQVSFDKVVQFRMTRIDPDLKPDTDFSSMRFDVGIDGADKDGITPYMKAASLGQSEIFRMFAGQKLCEDFDIRGRSWISHAIENRQEKFLVEAFGQVNTEIPRLPPNHDSGSRITPELLSHADSAGCLPLAHARRLGLDSVAAGIESFCRLTIEKCDRDIKASADYAVWNRATRELCLKALGEELPVE